MIGTRDKKGILLPPAWSGKPRPKDPHGGRGPHDGAGGTWDKKNGGPHTGGPEPF